MPKTMTREVETAEQAEVSVEESKHEAARPVERAPMEIPSSLYLFATGASILASLMLFLRRNKEAGIFVGLWPATILGVAVLQKLTRSSKES